MTNQFSSEELDALVDYILAEEGKSSLSGTEIKKRLFTNKKLFEVKGMLEYISVVDGVQMLRATHTNVDTFYIATTQLALLKKAGGFKVKEEQHKAREQKKEQDEQLNKESLIAGPAAVMQAKRANIIATGAAFVAVVALGWTINKDWNDNKLQKQITDSNKKIDSLIKEINRDKNVRTEERRVLSDSSARGMEEQSLKPKK